MYIVLAVLVLASCAHAPMKPKEPFVHKIEIPALTVYLMNEDLVDVKAKKMMKFKNEKGKIIGLAFPGKNWIFVAAEYCGKFLCPREDVLVHEFLHFLNWADPIIQNPDLVEK
jgi:hypothetical protein